MIDAKLLQKKILANGKVEGHEVELLRSVLYEKGEIGRVEIEFLVDLHRRVERVTPAFEHFFYTAIKKYVLADKKISAPEALWLRGIILDDGKVSERDKKLLRELKGEATRSSPEFEELVQEIAG
jgi:hypothetical protein